MTLTERVANFMATSQPGDAIALSKDADVDAGTGLLLHHGPDGFFAQLTYRESVPANFDADLIVTAAEVLCLKIGTTLDS